MQSSSVLRFAGDVSVDKVRIITPNGFYQDIAAQVVNIQFYEDLFSPFITGSLILKESLDLINLFPFVGEEYLELEVSTPTLDVNNIKGKFYIYKLTNREMVGDRAVAYQLHFISTEAIVDLNKKPSRVFADKVSKLIEPFIKDNIIGLESDKKVFVEETSNNIKYISNFWSPVKNIMYLAEKARNRNSVPNYVFFENRDGFYFISLESLYSNAALQQEFLYDNYSRDFTKDGKSVKNITEDYKRITSINIPVGFDYINNIQSGMYSSKLVSYDVVKKTYTSRNYNMFEKFNSQKHLNPFPVNSDRVIFRSNAVGIIYPKMFGRFNGFGEDSHATRKQERVSLMSMAEANKIEITVPGRTDYTVGQRVKVLLNRVEPISSRDDNVEDKVFSGYYLIGAINHYIDRENHECRMELIKDSSLLDKSRGK
jgi:hypothetical protein